MEKKLCQSCGMPLTKEELGSDKDGNKSSKYCKYCYQDGKFAYDCTMDEMIEVCIKPMVDEIPDMSEEKAKSMMKKIFPSLERWK